MGSNRPQVYKKYDHRLKALVARTDDREIVARLKIPASTVRSWRGGEPDRVVTHEVVVMDAPALQARILELESKCAELEARLELHAEAKRLLGWGLGSVRIPGTELKEKLLGVIESASRHAPLALCLDTVGLSFARYKSWMLRRRRCRLQDYSSCPKLSPTKLTADEVATMREMIADPRYEHFPVRSLALHAARMGKVVASPATWQRRVRRHGWKRPRKRVYPARPKIGVRASQPNEIWHIDVTMLRLLDGTRAAVQVCLDNFSRYVLAWRVARTPTALGTRTLLLAALSRARELEALPGVPRVVCDAGVENLNAEVDSLIGEGRIVREVAQVEVDYSNSMVEAFFRSAKHNFLFNAPLPSLEALSDRMAFYVREHNERMPHAAFRGTTPEETYAGSWRPLVESATRRAFQTAASRRALHHGRLDACAECPVAAGELIAA